MATINSVDNGLSGSTGTGTFVGATSPTLITPLLGTPTSGTLTNCTGLPVGGISAIGTPSSSTYLRGDGSWNTPAGGGGGLTWVDQASTPVTMTTNYGYTCDDGSTLVVFTLPTTSAIGDQIEINGKGSGGWQIAQVLGQQIVWSGGSTTSGTGGSLASSGQYDCVVLRCLTANTIWTLRSATSKGLTWV